MPPMQDEILCPAVTVAFKLRCKPGYLSHGSRGPSVTSPGAAGPVRADSECYFKFSSWIVLPRPRAACRPLKEGSAQDPRYIPV